MFARIRKNSHTNRRSVLVCHNIRVGSSVEKIIVKVFGHSSDEEELQTLLSKAKDWIKENGEKWLKTTYPGKRMALMKKKNVSLFDLEEKARINVGIEDVFGKLYNELGFNTLLSKTHQETLKKVIFARILEPSSKRRASSLIEKEFDDELPLERIYRMMDSLFKKSEEIQKNIFDSTMKAVDNKISLILFDVTTLSFESITEDELRAFGYSKDFKFNTTQVTLALATTKEGLPVGYRVFPGNTAESKTLIASIEAWKQFLPIENVTVVGDRAMMSENNLLSLEEAGFTYVIACPLKKLSKSNQEAIFDPAGYHEKNFNNEINRYKIIELEDRKLLVSYSSKRASKDAKDRERLVSKLRKKLETCKDAKRLINKNGYLKYSEISGKATASIDEQKILEEAKWDGIHGVITNQKACDIDIYDQYKRLWVIEESFRINKHNLKMRPIYHFTPRRIYSHILLCYMVFTMIRHIQHRLQKSNQSMSVNRIIDSVRDIEASILIDTTNDNAYRMLSRLNDDAKTIYNVLDINKDLSIIQLNSM